jgi:hypothetical protein
MLGLWFLESLLETTIRRNAVMLIAVEFPKLLAVFGTLLGVEMFVRVRFMGVGDRGVDGGVIVIEFFGRCDCRSDRCCCRSFLDGLAQLPCRRSIHGDRNN